MALDYTTTKLLEDIRTVCLTPEADALYTDARLLALTSNEQLSTVVPQLLSIQEEFFVHYEDVPLSADQTAYDIPERAIGLKLRDVSLIDSSGNENYIGRINPADAKFYGGNVLALPMQIWNNSFYFRDSQIILLPNVAQNFTYLRLYFYRRPSQLVVESEAGHITAIDRNTNTITLSSRPSAMIAGVEIDFLKGRPPFRSYEDDRAIASVSNNDVTFAAELPDSLVVGDWIALSGETPIPQFPYEIFPMLEQLGACKALEGMGDANIDTAWGRYKQMRDDAFKLLSPRTDSPAQKVVSPNSIFNRGNGRGWGW